MQKIDQVHFVTGCDHHIRWFEVTKNDGGVLRMQVIQDIAESNGDRKHTRTGSRPLGASSSRRSTFCPPRKSMTR